MSISPVYIRSVAEKISAGYNQQQVMLGSDKMPNRV